MKVFMTAMGICLAIGKPLLHSPHTCANEDIGGFKKVMGYESPPATSEDPMAQVTDYLPGQRLLEQVNVRKRKTIAFANKILARVCVPNLYDSMLWIHQAQRHIFLPSHIRSCKRNFR